MNCVRLVEICGLVNFRSLWYVRFSDVNKLQSRKISSKAKVGRRRRRRQEFGAGRIRQHHSPEAVSGRNKSHLSC